ncbi:MAG: HIT family protein [Dehalococcoidia bacterium]
MYNHEPEGYDCPFCRLVRGLDTRASSQDDVVYRDNDVTAFVASGWWPNNSGHVLVVTNAHYENIYDLPPELAYPIQRVARVIAIAFRERYGCDGASTRQHNEPAGNQDVWHYHLHVFPRYAGDGLYLHRRRSTTPEERRPYAIKLREALASLDRSSAT